PVRRRNRRWLRVIADRERVHATPTIEHVAATAIGQHRNTAPEVGRKHRSRSWLRCRRNSGGPNRMEPARPTDHASARSPRHRTPTREVDTAPVQRTDRGRWTRRRADAEAVQAAVCIDDVSARTGTAIRREAREHEVLVVAAIAARAAADSE